MDDERDSDVTSLDGGDDDDEYQPLSLPTTSTTSSEPSSSQGGSETLSLSLTTSELASRLRRQRQHQRSAAVVAAAAVRSVVEDTEESDSSGSDAGARVQTSNVRRAVDSPDHTADSPMGHADSPMGQSAIGQPDEMLLAQHSATSAADGSAEWVDLLKVWLAYDSWRAVVPNLSSCFPIFTDWEFMWLVGEDRAVRNLRMRLTV